MTAAQEQALATTQTTQLQVIESWQSTEALKARIQQIQRLMNEVLQKDVDYGVIPGMPKGTKPSLFKPGSEQILAMFRIAVDPVVEDLSTDDCYRYRVTVRLTDARTEAFLGAGVGEASTDETKYKWKRTYSEQEFRATDPDRRRSKWVTYKDDHGQGQEVEQLMVRQEPADLANTVLKMAKKRAQIDATLTVTGASSMFDQDLEDFGEDGPPREQEAPTARRGRKAQKPKQEDVKCADCSAVNGHLPSCKYHPDQMRSRAQAAADKPAEPKSEPKTIDGQVTDKPTDRMVRIFRKSGDATTKGGVSYVWYEVQGNDNSEERIYCFHKTVNAELKANAMGKVCMFRFSIDRTYTKVEEILEIAGTQYKEGKPVGGQKAEEPW